MAKKVFPEWGKLIGIFAKKVGKKPEEITEALVKLTGEPSKEALDILANEEAVPANDLKNALKDLNIPSGVFNMHVNILRGPKKEKEKEGPNKNSAMEALAILPSVPDETSFLEMLVTGGVLKVDTTEVLSAVKAALANNVGLFDLPRLIAKKMEDHAVSQEEPVGENFYEMEKMLTQARYGDVLKAMNVTGKFVSEKRKKDFFSRLQNSLWVSMGDFHKLISTWNDSWIKGAGNPAAIMMVMASKTSGGTLPAGVMTPPDTSTLRSASEAFADTINQIFAGTGIPVARALAFDATRIMKILNNKDLPGQIGSSGKDQMLKDLGINIGSDLARVEVNLTRYALAIMSFPKVTPEAELNYLVAMMQLGASIPWSKVGVSVSKAGIGVGEL